MNDGNKLSAEKLNESLALSTEFSRKLNTSTPIKPCIALMMNSVIAKGDYVSRHTALHIICCELLTCGVNEDKCLKWALKWNRNNDPPMYEKEVHKLVWKVYNRAKEYHYTCRNPMLQSFCVDFNLCPQKQKISKYKFNLFEFTEKRWQELAARLVKEPFTKKAARDFHRMFFGSAVDVKPDKTGRILIPENLKSFVGIKKDVVLMGVIDRIEIWDSQLWKQRKSSGIKDYESLAEQLFSGEVEY